MVDPIGLKPVLTSKLAVTRVAAVATPGTASSQDEIASTTGVLTRDLAATPPIDYERVAQIRKAIAEGSFPITPAEIADRLIAAKFEWTRSDSQ